MADGFVEAVSTIEEVLVAFRNGSLHVQLFDCTGITGCQADCLLSIPLTVRHDDHTSSPLLLIMGPPLRNL